MSQGEPMDFASLQTRIIAASGSEASALARTLVEAYASETHVSSAGFPALSETAFSHFRDQIPHLFQNACRVLEVLAELEAAAAPIVTDEEAAHLDRAAKVIRTVINTAGITSAPDLWLVRHVVGALHEVGLSSRLLAGDLVRPEAARDDAGQPLDAIELSTDLNLLVSRGYLRREDGGYRIEDDHRVRAVFERLGPVPPGARATLSMLWHSAFTGEALSAGEREVLCSLTETLPIRPPSVGVDWVGTWEEVELSFKVLPVLVALKMAGRCEALGGGEAIELGTLAPREPEIERRALRAFEAAGFLELGDTSATPTILGRRVFDRGPGPYGIIETYQPYMSRLVDILRDGRNAAWVSRGANVIASQTANRRTFVQCNDALDRFCRETGFTYEVFIEHALGRGEATRQRWERSGEEGISYVGADLEAASIEQALNEQSQGNLPVSMLFVRQADIGDPAYLLANLRGGGVEPRGSVMMVGNGFHEVRNQTDEKMERIFRGYQDAGIVLIFTEANALTIEDLRHSAYNTYHAGFMYVHAKSGQGLRPADRVPAAMRSPELKSSWTECATRAGYVKAAHYVTRSRTVYPHPREDGYNPTISTNHFFFPARLAQELNVD